MSKIPVTIITGFLGAGKTTLIRHLLQNNQGRRLAVLVNEFGEMGIDGELLESCQLCEQEFSLPANATRHPIIELTNGCLCCTVQEEFFPVMTELLERRSSLDAIIIETSGLALPKPLVQAFRWPEIRSRATVDGVVTVVDALALSEGKLVEDWQKLLAQRQGDEMLDHETPLEELFEDQLACADLIVLAKVDQVNEQQQQLIKNQLALKLRPGVKIIASRHGHLPLSVLLGFNSAVEEQLSHRPSHHDGEEDHEHDEDIEVLQWVCLATPDEESFLAELQRLLVEQEIYRLKGFVNLPHKPMRLVVQGVGDRLESFYDRSWRAGEVRQTQIVLIGRHLAPLRETLTAIAGGLAVHS